MRETQEVLVIVAPQACTDGVDVLKSVILAHAKGYPDIDQSLGYSQITECANKDDYNICVNSTHMESLCPLLQCMHYMNNNPGVRLFMIVVLHGDG